MAAMGNGARDAMRAEEMGRDAVRRRVPLRRIGAAAMVLGCLLVLISLWVPWVTVVSPAHFSVPGTTHTIRPVDGSASGAPYILGCPGLGLILPLVALAIAALDLWRRGSARAPLPLVMVAALIGLVCAPLLLVVGGLGAMTLCFRCPPETALVEGGMMLALAGYGAGVAGCILAMV